MLVGSVQQMPLLCWCTVVYVFVQIELRECLEYLMVCIACIFAVEDLYPRPQDGLGSNHVNIYLRTEESEAVCVAAKSTNNISNL